MPVLPFLCSLISGTGLLPGPMAALLGPVAALPGPTLLPGGAAAPLGGLLLGVWPHCPEQLSSRRVWSPPGQLYRQELLPRCRALWAP